jgi:hypothetical protein
MGIPYPPEGGSNRSRAPERARRLAEVADEAFELPFTRVVVLRPQDGGRVDRREHGPVRGFVDDAPAATDPELAAQERLRGGRPERNDELRLDGGDLRLEPGEARPDVGAGRLLVEPPLAPADGRQRKCLTAFVTYTAERSMPASASARSRILPAGPTNGLPAMSSWSPGCSPTRTSAADAGPSPNTVCVPSCHSSHARQPAAASSSE